MKAVFRVALVGMFLAVFLGGVEAISCVQQSNAFGSWYECDGVQVTQTARPAWSEYIDFFELHENWAVWRFRVEGFGGTYAWYANRADIGNWTTVTRITHDAQSVFSQEIYDFAIGGSWAVWRFVEGTGYAYYANRISGDSFSLHRITDFATDVFDEDIYFYDPGSGGEAVQNPGTFIIDPNGRFIWRFVDFSGDYAYYYNCIKDNFSSNQITEIADISMGDQIWNFSTSGSTATWTYHDGFFNNDYSRSATMSDCSECSSGACCSPPYYRLEGSQPTGLTDDYFWDGTEGCSNTSYCKSRDYYCSGTSSGASNSTTTLKTCGSTYRNGVCNASTWTCTGGDCSSGLCCDTATCLYRPNTYECDPGSFGACTYATTCAELGSQDKTTQNCSGGSASCTGSTNTVSQSCGARSTNGVSCDTCKQCSAGSCTAWKPAGTIEGSDCCTGSGIDSGTETCYAAGDIAGGNCYTVGQTDSCTAAGWGCTAGTIDSAKANCLAGGDVLGEICYYGAQGDVCTAVIGWTCTNGAFDDTKEGCYSVGDVAGNTCYMSSQDDSCTIDVGWTCTGGVTDGSKADCLADGEVSAGVCYYGAQTDNCGAGGWTCSDGTSDSTTAGCHSAGAVDGGLCYITAESDQCVPGVGWGCSGGSTDSVKPTNCSYHTGICPGAGCTLQYNCTGNKCTAGSGWECYGDSRDSGCLSCADADNDDVCDPIATCGDGTCDAVEDATNCPDDCCEADCTAVGDSVCHAECDTYNSCVHPDNCNVCGDGACGSGETAAGCPADCGGVRSCTLNPPNTHTTAIGTPFGYDMAYSNFVNDPVIDPAMDCLDGSPPPSFSDFNPGVGGSGTGNIDCGPYTDAGTYIVDYSLRDGLDVVLCGPWPLTIIIGPQCGLSAAAETINDGEGTGITVNYNNFAGVPASATVDCGGWAGSVSCAGSGSGSCTINCGTYSAGGYVLAVAGLTDGPGTADCGSAAITVQAAGPSPGPDCTVPPVPAIKVLKNGSIAVDVAYDEFASTPVFDSAVCAVGGTGSAVCTVPDGSGNGTCTVTCASVNDTGRVKDVILNDGASPIGCTGSALVYVCGNNDQESGEECDGTDDAACFGENCLPNCTCFVPEGGGDVFNISLLQIFHGIPPTPASTFTVDDVVTVEVTVQNKVETQDATVDLSILKGPGAGEGLVIYGPVQDTLSVPGTDSVPGGGSTVFTFTVDLSTITGIEAGNNYTVKAYARPGKYPKPCCPPGEDETVLANNTRKPNMSVIEFGAATVPELPPVFVVLVALGVLAVLVAKR